MIQKGQCYKSYKTNVVIYIDSIEEFTDQLGTTPAIGYRKIKIKTHSIPNVDVIPEYLKNLEVSESYFIDEINSGLWKLVLDTDESEPVFQGKQNRLDNII